MHVLVKRYGQPLTKVEVTDMYQTLTSEVGGWLEHTIVRIDGVTVDVWLDEEGKLKNLEPNMLTDYDTLVGPLVFTGGADDAGKTLGITPEIEAAVHRYYEGKAYATQS